LAAIQDIASGILDLGMHIAEGDQAMTFFGIWNLNITFFWP
jgi:hypothetical protein